MLLYNNTFILQQDLKLSITNRAFQYSDGFFETIMVKNGKLCFWRDHQARIREAATALQLVIPNYFWDVELEENLLQLAKQRNAIKLGRLKLKVWRAGEGLYTPQTNKIEWVATVEPSQPIPNTGLEIGICHTVKTCFSSLSHFKGPHAPLYVLAGIEKQENGFDDMLLLDAQGQVAELIASNIFWVKDEQLFTPSLEVGCVNGIVRRNILRWCQLQGIATQETFAKTDDLALADCVFAANVTGIRNVLRLEEQQLINNTDMLASIKKGLKL